MKELKPSVPTKEQALRMRAYDNIDKLLTKRENRDKTYRCPAIRGLILSIGEKIK